MSFSDYFGVPLGSMPPEDVVGLEVPVCVIDAAEPGGLAFVALVLLTFGTAGWWPLLP